MDMHLIFIVLSLGILSIEADENVGPSHHSEFIYQPDNMTIPKGEMAIMKCKVAKAVQRCRWYFLEEGLDFFDGRVNPVMVKDFKPKNPQDCSIKLKTVREVQEGQWLCQALQIHKSEFIVSKPGLLKVITDEEAAARELSSREGRKEVTPEIDIRPRFLTEEDDHIQNTYLGAEVTLDCRVNQPLSTCSWVMPHGSVLHYTHYKIVPDEERETKPDYGMQGNITEGNCSVTVRYVRMQDEGNWRCMAEVKDETIDETVRLMGPIIHLHLMEYSHAAERTEDLASFMDENTTLLVSLLFVTLLLLVIIALLFYCNYIKKRASPEEKKTILQPSSVSPENYSQKWIQKLEMGAEPQFTNTLKKSRDLPINCTDISQYNQYLDMNGTIDGYIVMPENSIRSSMGTTPSSTSTMPVDRDRTMSSATTTSNLSNESNGCYIPFEHGDKIKRTLSIYSTGHLYEEIPEGRCEMKMKMGLECAMPTPLYTNLNQDQEGYMIPKRKLDKIVAENKGYVSSEPMVKVPKKEAELPYAMNIPNKAPAYCQVGERKEETLDIMAINLEYEAKANLAKLQNYDVPRGSTESLTSHRSSKSSPEESYDIPRPTSTTATVTEGLPHAKVQVSLGNILGTIV